MKSSHSGFTPLMLAVIFGVLILGGATYFGSRNFPSPRANHANDPYENPPSLPIATPGASSHAAILSTLITEWKSVQADIPERPVLGATAWNYPNIIQFLSPTALFLQYEDGHVVRHSLFLYESKNFKHVVTFSLDSISQEMWQELKDRYSVLDDPMTYTFIFSPTGTEVAPSDWRREEQNPFVTDKTPIKPVEPMPVTP